MYVVCWVSKHPAWPRPTFPSLSPSYSLLPATVTFCAWSCSQTHSNALQGKEEWAAHYKERSFKHVAQQDASSKSLVFFFSPSQDRHELLHVLPASHHFSSLPLGALTVLCQDGISSIFPTSSRKEHLFTLKCTVPLHSLHSTTMDLWTFVQQRILMTCSRAAIFSVLVHIPKFSANALPIWCACSQRHLFGACPTWISFLPLAMYLAEGWTTEAK